MIKSISEVKIGSRIDYGFFRGVKVTEINDDEVIFQDKNCNDRKASMDAFLKNAILRPATEETAPEVDHPVKTSAKPKPKRNRQKKSRNRKLRLIKIR